MTSATTPASATTPPPADRPAPAPAGPWRAGRRLLLVAVPTGGYAALGWTHRWLSDDGLITLRVAAQVLAGQGPVFNAGERVEVSTSAAWTWLLVAAGWLFPAALPSLAVGLGLAGGTAGVALALDATGRLWRPRTGTAGLVPAGVLVVLALPPFWEFATSGLETGLTVGWVGVCWWLLVRAALDRPGPGWALGAAAVLGLGPLVRPDLAVVSAVLLLALVAVLRPGARRVLALTAAAVALPLAYQVFRAGYYGTLVPTPALAKEAALPRWDQGAVYLLDLLRPYWLPVPLLALAVAAVAAGRPGRWPAPRRVVLAAPVVAGLLSWLYVVRVGGDFMHARLLLPGLWCLLLPVLVLPLGGRVARAALAATSSGRPPARSPCGSPTAGGSGRGGSPTSAATTWCCPGTTPTRPRSRTTRTPSTRPSGGGSGPRPRPGGGCWSPGPTPCPWPPRSATRRCSRSTAWASPGPRPVWRWPCSTASAWPTRWRRGCGCTPGAAPATRSPCPRSG